MNEKFFNLSKIKYKYLKFIKSQEIPGEPFRNKSNQLNKYFIPISKKIYESHCYRKETIIVGLSGGQGSGKSTISKILKIILKEKYNLETVIFSIDDFYKTLNERVKMSKKINKLFLTRGVPGTHDTKMLKQFLKNLKSKSFKKILLPKFDKSADDRSKKKMWKIIKKKPDIVIFEGWCVGAIPEGNNSLIKPINDLERSEDQALVWRRTVNNELKHEYKKIFKLIDILIFLKVPNLKYVYKWRVLQEKKLKRSSNGKKIMSNAQIKTFIMHYERVTRNMLKTLDKKAHIKVSLDTKHRLNSINLR